MSKLEFLDQAKRALAQAGPRLGEVTQGASQKAGDMCRARRRAVAEARTTRRKRPATWPAVPLGVMADARDHVAGTASDLASGAVGVWPTRVTTSRARPATWPAVPLGVWSTRVTTSRARPATWPAVPSGAWPTRVTTSRARPATWPAVPSGVWPTRVTRAGTASDLAQRRHRARGRRA